jgi:hypothetical protein
VYKLSKRDFKPARLRSQDPGLDPEPEILFGTY